MQIHELKSPEGSRKRRKIVGRGKGSGHGKTSCRGHKGENARQGRAVLLGSEGGQSPLIRRLPKVGFNSKRPLVYQLVKLVDLSGFKEGTLVDAHLLVSQQLIRDAFKPYKILGDGDISKAITCQAYSFSKSAEAKIIKAGGKIEIINAQILKEQISSTKN